MSSIDWRAYLHDILDCIAKIERYVADLEEADFVDDDLRSDAVIRNLEIIGEAARGLSKVNPEAAEQIPWAQAWAMRNVLTHGYRGVDLGIVWDTIKEDLPVLKAAASKAIASDP